MKPNRFQRKIEMIKLFQQPYASRRIEQLALPKVRKLVAAREEYKKFINQCWYDRFTKTIKKSMFTVYSQLGKTKLPSLEVEKPQKWTQDDWERHLQWLKDRAQPKKEIKPKPRKRKLISVDRMLDCTDRLAMPLERKFTPKYEPEHRPAIETRPKGQKLPKFDISPRIVTLSTPKMPRPKGAVPDDSDQIPPNVLKYTPSERILEMAKPRSAPAPPPYSMDDRYTPTPYLYKEDNPFAVIPRALKAKATERTLQLAKPKIRSTK